jgi:hypothetical protein
MPLIAPIVEGQMHYNDSRIVASLIWKMFLICANTVVTPTSRMNLFKFGIVDALMPLRHCHKIQKLMFRVEVRVQLDSKYRYVTKATSTCELCLLHSPLPVLSSLHNWLILLRRNKNMMRIINTSMVNNPLCWPSTEIAL